MALSSHDDPGARLRRELVGARLKTDDRVSFAQLFDAEAADVSLDWSWTDRRTVESVALALHITSISQHDSEALKNQSINQSIRQNSFIQRHNKYISIRESVRLSRIVLRNFHNFVQRRSQEFDLGGYKWVKGTKQPHKKI